MSLHSKPNYYRPLLIIIAGSAVIREWWLWKNAVKKQKEHIHDHVEPVMTNVDLPAGQSEEHEDTQEMSPLQDMCIPQKKSWVLSHSYVSGNNRNICKPGHWHATYWLQFVEDRDAASPSPSGRGEASPFPI